METRLMRMNDLILHRGPDDFGSYCDTNEAATVGMAMRRLSIIDIHSGKQPISTKDGSKTIVYNGEIYNYRELRAELINDGVIFTTHSDTEVVLHLYDLYGTDRFSDLDGMFAFSIHDKIKNKVYIARDYFGEKPLYYTKNDDEFIYASELKSVVGQLDYIPEICSIGLSLYLRLTYIPAPYTIYKNIYKLEPDNLIDYDLYDHSFAISKISSPEIDNVENIRFDVAVKDVRELVTDSVLSRSVSDVPVGTFLSGGVDSSIVSQCLATATDTKIDTFSIGFENARYDETAKSRAVANMIGSNHHEFIVGVDDLVNYIDQIILNFDEPFADASALPTYFVSMKTSKSIKVALTGDGGDEAFGGYNKHYMGKINGTYTKYIPERFHKYISSASFNLLKTRTDNRGYRFRVRRLINAIDYNDDYYWNIISLGLNKKLLTEMMKNKPNDMEGIRHFKDLLGYESPGNLNEFREVDKVISLEGDLLVKVDRTSMQNSLECRAPFLNKAIWNYTDSLPSSFLIKGWNKKFILKEAFKHHFPDKFLDAPKKGFGVPVGDWLRTNLKSEVEKFCDEKYLRDQNIFNEDATIKLVRTHLEGEVDNTLAVWTFYCFQKWYQNTYLTL